MRRRDGQYRWLIDNGVPVVSSDGAFQGYIGSCIDITDRMHAETSLRESQRQLASIIGSAMDAIITVDSSTRLPKPSANRLNVLFHRAIATPVETISANGRRRVSLPRQRERPASCLASGLMEKNSR